MFFLEINKILILKFSWHCSISGNIHGQWVC